MYYFLKRIGNNYSVIDSDDGAIDWLSKNELRGYVQDSGIEIQGVAKDMSELKPQIVPLAAEKCNWADGENVFATARGFWVTTDGFFTLKAGKKQFKGALRKVNETVARLEFNYGVHVEFAVSDFDALRSNKQELTVPIIKSVVETKQG